MKKQKKTGSAKPGDLYNKKNKKGKTKKKFGFGFLKNIFGGSKAPSQLKGRMTATKRMIDEI